MVIELNSSYDKRLKYKIYGINDGKRKLLGKGVFLDRATAEIAVSGNELIVRIQRLNIFIAFWAAVYVGLVNFYNSIFHRQRLLGAEVSRYLSLYPFEELRIKDLDRGETTKIYYNRSPLFKQVDSKQRTVQVEYLTCKTHPYEEEPTARRATNRILYALTLLFWLAVIEAVCQIIVFALHR